MLKNFNYKNIKNVAIKRNKNSDLINAKDEYYNTNFKTTMSSNYGNNTIYLSDTLKVSNSKRKNLIKINNTEKKSRNENNMKIKKITEQNNSEKNIQKRKTQTQTDLYWNNNSFFKTYLNKIPNISVIKKRKKINSGRYQENKIIYFNSSIENFYHKKKKEYDSPLSNKIKSLSSLPRSSKVYFINTLLKQYKIKNKDKNLEKIKMRIKLNKKINNGSNEPEEEIINSKLLKGFSLLSGNKSALKILFRKRPIKVGNTLNPIMNSYGNILDDLSGKIGFMKDSMNLIYPKVSQAKYLFNGIKIDFDSVQKNRSLIEDYNINQNKIKSKFILYQIKKKKINQTVYSKYPLSLNNKSKSEKILTAKIYSLRRKKLN